MPDCPKGCQLGDLCLDHRLCSTCGFNRPEMNRRKRLIRAGAFATRVQTFRNGFERCVGEVAYLNLALLRKEKRHHE